MPTPELTLFMLVTNRDCIIADASVRSYAKVWKVYDSFVLEIYANCISEANKQILFPGWRKLPYVRIRENTKEREINRVAGEHFTTPEGISLRYDDNCEHYDEVWTREHKKATTPFWGTVDADFEVLKGNFIPEMVRRLRADFSMGGISTDHSPLREKFFESYSGESVENSERNHTWCCIYRKETAEFLDEVSTFYFETRDAQGLRHCYDSYGNFQRHLRTKGFHFGVLPDADQWKWIHYGAFSKNRSITRKNVWMYRLLAIGAKRGLLPFPGWWNTKTKKVCERIFRTKYAKQQQERHSYLYEQASRPG